jgi:hypothetical protein
MGIVKTFSELESYLDGANIRWEILSDKEYRKLVTMWRNSFENNLISEMCIQGSKGFRILESRLPLDGYLFNCPNYTYLPNNEGKDRQLTFGYRIKELKSLDRNMLNAFGVILCNAKYSYMCAFNLDGPDGFPEVYCEV